MTLLTGTMLLTGCGKYLRKPDYVIPYLFDCPRKENFTTIPWERDNPDDTSIMHFGFSSGIYVGLSRYLKHRGVKHHKLWSAIGTLGLGALKETEDGYREGFGRMDLCMDIGGIIFGATLENVIWKDKQNKFRIDLKKQLEYGKNK